MQPRQVTAEGRLLLCLGNEHSVDLRAILRQPTSPGDSLKSAIVEAMALKPERHHFDNEGEPQIVRFMNATGARPGRLCANRAGHYYVQWPAIVRGNPVQIDNFPNWHPSKRLSRDSNPSATSAAPKSPLQSFSPSSCANPSWWRARPVSARPNWPRLRPCCSIFR